MDRWMDGWMDDGWVAGIDREMRLIHWQMHARMDSIWPEFFLSTQHRPGSGWVSEEPWSSSHTGPIPSAHQGAGHTGLGLDKGESRDTTHTHTHTHTRTHTHTVPSEAGVSRDASVGKLPSSQRFGEKRQAECSRRRPYCAMLFFT